MTKAAAHYEQALALCPEDDAAQRSSLWFNQAELLLQQGEVERAIALYQQSLQLYEQINDVQGKSASLHQIAGIYAQQGEVERAIALYQQSLQLDEQINDVKGKSASLHQIAGIYAQQGEVERAIALYQQSLQLDEQINDVQGKSASLHAIAGIYAQQGEVERAIALYQQSLQLDEQINDVKGKSASLHQIAGIYAQQGEVERAIALYQQSLQLKEQINDVQGKAATLANLAYWAGERGDRVRQFDLNLQAAKALGEARAYVNLFTVLGNLGGTAEANPQIYLSQALWLALRIQVRLPSLITCIRAFYNQVPQGDVMEALLAATALWFCDQRQEHPQHTDLQAQSGQLALGAAAAQGVNLEDSEAVGAWWQQQQLNDPQVFVPRLQARLEALVGDGWLFERDAF